MNRFKLILVALLFPSFIFAQESSSYSREDITLLTDTVKLNEIIIEASKTGDNLQEIPVATSYIPAQEIEEQNINSLTELSARVPNFFMPDYGSRLTSPIYIRGVGNKLNAPTVGLYVDNVPYFDKGSFNFEFFDIEKIEILRGPQGTLYGRNTMGGVIKVYTPEPKFNSTGSVKVEYGTKNHIKTGFKTNQKLTESLALIIGGAHAHSDGYLTNTFSNTQADKFDVYNGNLKLLYNPSEKLKAILSINYEKSDQKGYPYALYDTDTQEASEISYNQESTYDRSLLSLGLSVEYKAESFILSSATSFQHMEDFQGIDQDFTPADLFWVSQNRVENTWVQELTIRSLSTSKINWLAGVFAMTQSSDKEVGVNYGADAITAYHLPGPINYIKEYALPTSAAAIFGQVSYPFGKFKATAGIRADYETTTLDYDYEKWLNGSTTIDSDNFEIDDNFTEVLPKATLSFFPTENITIFTSYGKGFKAGGFNTSFANIDEQSFDPERNTNYELGIKSVCMNNRLTTNLNIFYIDMEDQQIAQPSSSGIGSFTDNAGSSYSKGIEFELRFLANKNLTVWGSYGYTEAKFFEYQPDATTDYNDNFIPFIPEYTLNLGGNYSVYFNSSAIRNATLTVNYQHLGKSFWNPENTAYQEAYGILNGRLNFHSKEFDFGIWGKNLLDTEYNAFYFEALGNSYVQIGKPVQYGVFVNFNI